MQWLHVENRTFQATTRGGRTGWRRGFHLFGSLFAFERSNLYVRHELYMERWLLYFAGFTLRLHKFFRGDDVVASHTHPWWFITFPLTDYHEKIFRAGIYDQDRIVKAFRFHFRPATFEHYVVGGVRLACSEPSAPVHIMACYKPLAQPFFTIVLTGRVLNAWGFYPFKYTPRQFVPHEEWN